jgi:cytochrome c556
MRRIFKTSIILVLTILVFGVAYAQFAKPEDAIGYRKAVMSVIGYHTGQMGAIVKGDKPYEKAVFARHAAVVETLSTLPWEACLTPGSDKGATTLKSAALNEKDKFMVAAKTFETEIQKLVKAAAGDDLTAVKTQFGELGKSCKGCHSIYRNL